MRVSTGGESKGRSSCGGDKLVSKVDYERESRHDSSGLRLELQSRLSAYLGSPSAFTNRAAAIRGSVAAITAWLTATRAAPALLTSATFLA